MRATLGSADYQKTEYDFVWRVECPTTSGNLTFYTLDSNLRPFALVTRNTFPIVPDRIVPHSRSQIYVRRVLTESSRYSSRTSQKTAFKIPISLRAYAVPRPNLPYLFQSLGFIPGNRSSSREQLGTIQRCCAPAALSTSRAK